MLDFRVETFLAVCRHMSFTKAALELHITQPAASQHIRTLEREYGTRFFTMEGKRLLLIDDIVTTGSTLSECCRVLLTAGAQSVVCAALATPRKNPEQKGEPS